MTSIIFAFVPQPMLGCSMVTLPLMDSLIQFMAHDTANRAVNRGYLTASAGYIPASRNLLAQNFLEKTNAEWLLMVDWDVRFEPNSVYQLLDAADPIERPVMSGLYVTWFGVDQGLHPCWMVNGENGPYSPLDDWVPGRVQELTSCGMGFVLIHRSVLERVAKLHPDDSWKWYGHDVIGDNHTGEDLTFCQRVRDAGFSVWGHGGVLVGHWKSQEMTVAHLGHTPPAYEVPIPTPSPLATGLRVLNVGGGSKQIPIPAKYDGWDHVLLDVKAGPDVDLTMDARDLELRNVAAPFDAVYCSHNIEHYYAHDVPKVLAAFMRVLRPGGAVDVRCPDLAEVCSKVADGVELDAVLYESPSGPIKARDVIYGYERQIEESGEPFYAHKTGFTAKTLRRSLEDAGFVNVSVTAAALELQAVGSKPGG